MCVWMSVSVAVCVCLRVCVLACVCGCARVGVCVRSRRIVKLCLRNGIPPDARNHGGETCVHTMCARRPYAKQLELVEYMAHHGCDAETQDLQGRTAMHVACSQGRTDLIDSLVNMGAEVRSIGHLPVAGCV